MTTPQPSQALLVLDRPNPFSSEVKRTAFALVPGQPLALYLREVQEPVITFLDGKIIEPEQRFRVIPRAGQQLVIARDLSGGGGNGKMILRSLAMLAVVAIAIFLPAIVGVFGYEFISAGWAMAAQAAVMVGGSLLVNTVLPPPSMKGGKQEQSYGWGGPQMTAQQGLPIPKQYGTLRRSGNVIDSYLTTTLTQQWLNILIDLGWGPAASVSQIEINGNPLSNYPNVWSDARLGRNEQALMWNFSDIINSYPQNTRLRSADGGFTLDGTGTATEAAEFEFSFPRGLWAGPNSDQSYDPWTVHLRVSYRKVGELDWTTVLRPRTTAGLPLNALNQAPYWLAVTAQWTPNPDNTMYVMDVSYGAADHYVGESYTATRDVPVYDGDGNVIGTQSLTVSGQWVLNPQGPGASRASGGGVNYVAVTDYKNVTHYCQWNRTVMCRDVVHIELPEPGQYEYKVEKLGSSQQPGDAITTSKEDDIRRGEETWFTQLREIQHTKLAYPNKVLLAIRALATDKLSGSALNVTAVVNMAAAPAMGYKNEIAYDQPLAYFRLGDTGATCVDLSGRGHSGSYSGAPLQAQPGLIAGSSDGAVSLTAADGVTLSSPVALPAAGWAVEFWCQPKPLTGGKILSNADGSVYVEYRRDLGTGHINFHFSDADHVCTLGLDPGVVHHVVLGKTPGGFLVLMDGAPEFHNDWNPPAWSLAAIGSGFVGALDELACYGTIQPGRLRQHYLTGSEGLHSALEDRAPDNPALVDLDMTLNPLYGGQESPSLIDVAAYTEWADFNDELVPDGQGGQIYRHIFNGVFDQTESLWAAKARLGQMSRTVLMRSGTAYTCVSDKPTVRSQLFTMGNIKQDSFKQSWPGLLDRANSVSGTFLDETNNWAKTPLRVMDEAAIAAGAPLQEAGTVDLFGITNPRAAWRELMYRLLASKAALETAQIDCALEGLAARVGSVVGLQHDVPQWGAGGRILQALADTRFQLDQAVTIEAGVAYVLMLALPAVNRSSADWLKVAPDTVQLTLGDAAPPANFKRLVDHYRGVEVGVVSYDSSSGIARLDPGALARWDDNAGVCDLYDIDVLETRNITSAAGTTDTVTIDAAFSVPPPDYATYFLGQLSDVQDFRVSAVGRRSDQEMTLQLTKYDPTMYGDLEPDLPPAVAAADQIAVSGLAVSEAPSATPQLPVITITWQPGKLTYGVRLYLTRSGLPEYLVEDVVGRNYTQLSVSADYAYTVRAVGYDLRGYAAPYATAPTATVTPQGKALLPSNVSSFRVTAFDGSNATLAWDAVTDADLDHYEIRYSWSLAGVTWERATVLTPNPASTASSAVFASGQGTYLIKAVNAAGLYSGLASAAVASSAAPIVSSPDPLPDPLPKGGGDSTMLLPY